MLNILTLIWHFVAPSDIILPSAPIKQCICCIKRTWRCIKLTFTSPRWQSIRYGRHFKLRKNVLIVWICHSIQTCHEIYHCFIHRRVVLGRNWIKIWQRKVSFHHWNWHWFRHDNLKGKHCFLIKEARCLLAELQLMILWRKRRASILRKVREVMMYQIYYSFRTNVLSCHNSLHARRLLNYDSDTGTGNIAFSLYECLQLKGDAYSASHLDDHNTPKFRAAIIVTSWWARWRLKSPASRLFTQPFIQAENAWNIASLVIVWGIHRLPVNSPHKEPVTRKMFPFDDAIMAA